MIRLSTGLSNQIDGAITCGLRLAALRLLLFEVEQLFPDGRKPQAASKAFINLNYVNSFYSNIFVEAEIDSRDVVVQPCVVFLFANIHNNVRDDIYFSSSLTPWRSSKISLLTERNFDDDAVRRHLPRYKK